MYNVHYADPKLTGGKSLIKENIKSRRDAKSKASYFSIAAPPFHTIITEVGTGFVVAGYYNGRPFPVAGTKEVI